ncbi:PQQ-binding-like beta-propeller repeat protein [Acidicapsa acidisoli]|uniref:pyrrolo-quinoline quinone n=1 Tax=Acidicapsa acidisoli TaxID=1615681 RepID=UPI0021E0728C|nr:pyrrolo-quinoline quinone [Acidicapsa acidisoli]
MLKVDGDVYAQPLFLAGLDVPGKGRHDVLFVATEHDSVYAFDAYGHPSLPLWHVSFLRKGVTTVPADDVQCPYIEPEVGITSTPAIDPDTGTLYVLVRTKEQTTRSTQYTQRLHGLSVTTGLEQFGGPIEIRATINGKGTGSESGKLAFDPLRENPRASLLLANGLVYLSWASSCDVGPYHGWLMAYDAHSLERRAVFNTSPDGDDSGIWASDTGPAADGGGNLFVATGNGRFDSANGGRDYGDSLLKLEGQSLKIADYFAPFNVDKLNADDNDLGSGGPLLLPTQSGPHPHLVVIAGKEGTIYLIDRDHMGHHRSNNDGQIIQTVLNPGGGVFGSMAFWNHNLYVLSNGSNSALRQFALHNGKLTLKAASDSKFPGLAATPTASSNGMHDGVLWVLRSQGGNVDYSNAVLYAFDASDISHLLYTSEQNPGRDRAGPAVRFNIPTVVNGHVYVGAGHEVDVYGLFSDKKTSK